MMDANTNVTDFFKLPDKDFKAVISKNASMSLNSFKTNEK